MPGGHGLALGRKGLWCHHVPTQRPLLILLQAWAGEHSHGQAARGWPPQPERLLGAGAGSCWKASPAQDAEPGPRPTAPLPRGPGPGSARLQPDPPAGLCAACEGLAGSEQRLGARACRRVRAWRDFFQRSVYDNGREELSAETLTQPGPTGVGARAGLERGRDGGGQRDRETERRRDGNQEGRPDGDVWRAGQAGDSAHGHTCTHTRARTDTRVHTHTAPARVST